MAHPQRSQEVADRNDCLSSGVLNQDNTVSARRLAKLELRSSNRVPASDAPTACS